jgi:hypothetical protein
MEGKGTSGVADSLSTVRLSLLPSRSIFWYLAPEVRPDAHAGLVRVIYLPLTLLETHCRPARLVFTPAQIVNFAVVPPQFRFVFLSTVSLVWSASPPSEVKTWPDRAFLWTDTYLSIVNAKLGNDIAEPVD